MSTQEPPLPDYDSLPAGSVESRARTLDEQGVQELLDYERQHADRVQIVTMLENRLEGLRGGDVTPSAGDPEAAAPETPDGASGGSPVTPDTQGPPQNPPRHGVPSKPGQARS